MRGHRGLSRSSGWKTRRTRTFLGASLDFIDRRHPRKNRGQPEQALFPPNFVGSNPQPHASLDAPEPDSEMGKDRLGGHPQRSMVRNLNGQGSANAVQKRSNDTEEPPRPTGVVDPTQNTTRTHGSEPVSWPHPPPPRHPSQAAAGPTHGSRPHEPTPPGEGGLRVPGGSAWPAANPQDFVTSQRSQKKEATPVEITHKSPVGRTTPTMSKRRSNTPRRKLAYADDHGRRWMGNRPNSIRRKTTGKAPGRALDGRGTAATATKYGCSTGYYEPAPRCFRASPTTQP